MAPVFVGGVLALLVATCWDEWWIAVMPAFGLGALAGGHARAIAAESCAALLPLGEQRYVLQVVDPGEGTGRVGVIGVACRGAVVARWPAGVTVGSGETVGVTARWSPAVRALHRPDGMLLVSKVGEAYGHPGPLDRLRSGIVRATRSLYGARAPLANTLVAGWRGELDPELRAAFASAGLMHLIAISGLHVAWLAGWVFLLLRLLRLSRHRAALAAALVVLGYTAILGWPPAALRASVLLLIAGACRWRQRQVQFAAQLAASALVVLVGDPWAIVMPGLWLSIAGVTGVVAATRWSDRALGQSHVVRSVSGSTGALVATAPIAALVFGQVAPIGVVLNLVGLPLMLVLLPALFGSVLLYAWAPALAGALAASATGLMALLELLARVGAAAPGSAVAGAADWGAAVPWLGLAVAALWITHGQSTAREAIRRGAWCGVAALLVLVAGEARGPDATAPGALRLIFLDVGQGDAALIRTPLGHWIEVDAGPVGEGQDAGRRVVAPALLRFGARRVDLFVLSHAHRDHVGGGEAVLDRLPVDLAIEPGELFADNAYDGWLGALAAHHTRWRAAHAGDHWTVDGVAFAVLHPPSPWPRAGEDLNEDSIVLAVTFGTFRALLMGDAGFVAESVLATVAGPVDLLKVGHHGSRTASSAAFLATIRPQAAVISVGRNNYGHPAAETLGRLHAAGAQVWRTDEEGSVSVESDGHTFTVNGARTAATFGTRP